MYESFFGLKERPFQLIPNPEYFFYSSSHKEALAYLNYAVYQGDGFIEISGEVGTGKTVLCRTFIEKMGDSAEIAYIFNPKLDPQQLLQAINDDFGILPNSNTIKDLVDDLNEFLIRKKSENKKVILIIDEAQNLSKSVLEQLRLLSNLETITEKLLQIILVGQPELREKLNSYELRQLGQRITLSWTLYPLNLSETKQYIKHRLKIASFKSSINIPRSVLRQIYNYTKGSPRLINIACDRILLTAYSLNSHKINTGIAKISIKDLKSKGEKNEHSILHIKNISIIVLIIALFFVLNWLIDPFNQTVPKDTKTIITKQIPVKNVVIPVKKITKNIQLDDLIEQIKLSKKENSNLHAMSSGLSLWGVEYKENDLMNANLSNEVFLKNVDLKSPLRSLIIYNIEGFSLIKQLNLPTIFEFKGNDGNLGGRYYMTLYKIEKNILFFVAGDEKKTLRISVDDLIKNWTGSAHVLWKNYFKIENYLSKNSNSDEIITLKMLLVEVGFENLIINRNFDDEVENAIKLLQRRNGIVVDGIVGPRTKIVLYNEINRLKTPKLIDLSYEK